MQIASDECLNQTKKIVQTQMLNMPYRQFQIKNCPNSEVDHGTKKELSKNFQHKRKQKTLENLQALRVSKMKNCRAQGAEARNSRS